MTDDAAQARTEAAQALLKAGLESEDLELIAAVLTSVAGERPVPAAFADSLRVVLGDKVTDALRLEHATREELADSAARLLATLRAMELTQAARAEDEAGRDVAS